MTVAPPNMAPYHLPEVLLPPWFTHEPAQRARPGYSFWGSQTSFGAPCVSDTAIDYQYFDAKPDALSTWPVDINNDGEIVGYYYDAQANPHGFIRRDGRTRTVDVPGAARTYAFAISESHEIAGEYFLPSGPAHGFYSSNGRFLTFDVPGAVWTYIVSIGAGGRLGGNYLDIAGVTHGFIYERGRLTTLDMPGAANTYLNAFNEVGDLALSAYGADGGLLGSWVRHGPNGPSTLVAFPGDTSQTSISNLDNRGRVIGSFLVNGHTAADGFVRKEDGSFLRMLVYQAASMNDVGDMIGTRWSGQQYRGFVARVPRRP
jgi:YD repeat-containing protein